MKKFHFIGIGGIGMGTIASLLCDKGFEVSGSDLRENQLTDQLKSKGAHIFIGHQRENVDQADMVVFSSAIKKDNPEIQEARKRGITCLRRAQMLANLMSGHKSITVAGAHGKTTTTSMISHMLIKAGLKPTTAVGGVINGHSYSANLGSGTYFIAEVDESDGSFLYFSPYYSILTNIDKEHMDYYQTWENLKSAYREFIEKTSFDGTIIACAENEALMDLLIESKREFMMYGFQKEHDICALDVKTEGFSSSFECRYQGQEMGVVELCVPGRHNILNALSCIGLGLQLGIDFDVIAMSLSKYLGTQRRFQLKAKTPEIMIVDDYGHHPTEIKATLAAARSFYPQRLVVAFQPHRYSRTQSLMDEFPGAFDQCDYLILTDIYAASEEPIEGVTTQALYEKLKTRMKCPVVYLQKENIAKHISSMSQKGDLIITLGAGDINRISDQLAARLKNEYAKQSQNAA